MKRKETNKKKPQQAIESQRKTKSKITWRRQVSDPLGKGNGSTHPRQSKAQAKSANHQSEDRTPQRAPPAHMQAPSEPKHTPPEQMQQCNTGMQQRAKTCSLCPGRLDRLPQAVRPPTTHLTAPCDRPYTKLLKICPNQLEHLPNTPRCPKHAQTSPPCWQCMNQDKMRKLSTYSFSNIWNSSQGATQVQMSKLDTLQVRNDLNYVITKFHNHWTRLKRIWVILRKVTLSQAKT
jgi:hypothetical protein